MRTTELVCGTKQCSTDWTGCVALTLHPLSPALDLGFALLTHVAPPPQVVASVAAHAQDLPELTRAVKCAALPVANRELLMTSWKAWVEEAGQSGLHWQLPVSKFHAGF